MYKILQNGINGKMYQVIKLLYDSDKTKASVRISKQLTEWFLTTQGIKQSNSLSPIVFLLYINDMVKVLLNMNVGIQSDKKKVPILIYADDIMLVKMKKNSKLC